MERDHIALAETGEAGDATPDQQGGPGEDDATPPSSVATVDSNSMDALLAAVAAAPAVDLSELAGPPQPGDVVDGCYRIEDKLGEGGMGLVYLARDLDLDRDVALKIQRGTSRSSTVARLRREAKLMARLEHPNVVQVYGVGTHARSAFVAMQYLRGGTMRSWLDAPRSWRQTVALGIEVGDGVAAAHALGIVHRDLKPDNVLLGDDGRARVADFGLARLASTSPSDASDVAGEPSATPDDALRRLTRTGAIAGTPAYMAPEQFAGLEVGPAADQFALCVMLFEALHGERPFPGDSPGAVVAAITEQKIRAMPPDRAPRAVVQWLTKGLAADPADRHASVAELTAGLRGFHGRRRRRTVVAVGALAVAAAVTSGVSAATALQEDPCEAVADPMESVYGSAERDDVARALATAPADLEALDHFAGSWIAQRREACEATSVRGERSSLELGLRMACLDRAIARLDGVLTEIVDRPTVDASDAEVASLLPDLAVCEDVETLETLSNRLARRSARDSTAADLAQHQALQLLGQARARVQMRREGVLELASEAFELARAHELVVAQLESLSIMGDDAARLGRMDDAQRYRAQMGALAALVGDNNTAAASMFVRASAAVDRGALAEARVHMAYFTDYLAAAEDSTKRRDLSQRGAILHAKLAYFEGDFPDAALRYRGLVDALPEGSLDLDPALDGLASSLAALGKLPEAIAVWTRLQTHRAETIGSDAPALVEGELMLGTRYAQLDDFEHAHASMAKAKALLDIQDPAPVDEVTRYHMGMGYVLQRQQELEAAAEHLQIALRMQVDTVGESHPATCFTLDELAIVATAQGRFDEAIAKLTTSLSVREAHYGPRHPGAARTMTHLGRALIAKGDDEAAAKVLREALTIHEAAEADPVHWAETELSLAQAVVAADPATVAALAKSAKARLTTVAPRGAEVLEGFAALGH